MRRDRVWAAVLGLAMLAGVLVLAGCPAQDNRNAAVPPVDPSGAPAPATASGETIRQVGSTTVLPLAEKWREEFNKLHPEVDIAVSGGGSGTGIKSLIAKSCELADASRGIKDKEVEEAKAAGVNPVEHLVAYDGIAVVVNPANPLSEIALEKLSDIYTGTIKSWDQAGAKGLGDIQLVNRDSSSGTYDSFKEMVVQLHGKAKDREFAAGTLNQSSNEAIKSLVGQTKSAIGYLGLGYVDDSVKVLKVIPVGGKVAIAASAETVLDGTYPIARKLFCYTDGEPSGVLQQYLDWIKGAEGQAIVKELGFIPTTS